jgi:hypothetical protein
MADSCPQQRPPISARLSLPFAEACLAKSDVHYLQAFGIGTATVTRHVDHHVEPRRLPRLQTDRSEAALKRTRAVASAPSELAHRQCRPESLSCVPLPPREPTERFPSRHGPQRLQAPVADRHRVLPLSHSPSHGQPVYRAEEACSRGHRRVHCSHDIILTVQLVPQRRLRRQRHKDGADSQTCGR